MEFSHDQMMDVAVSCAEVTSARVTLGYDVTPGVRYVNHNTSHVFDGENAVRDAAIFYAFAAHDYVSRKQATSTPYLPAVILDVLTWAQDNPSSEVNEVADQGTNEGERAFRWR